jgi:hypothetical protein
MSSWIVPGLSDQHKLRAPKMIQEDPTLHLSATGRMRHALHYFLSFDNVGQQLVWSETQPSEWMEVIFGKAPGRSHTSWLWHKIIKLIFNKMHVIFIPHKQHVILALNAKLPVDSEDDDETARRKESFKMFLVRLNDWVKDS